ncbi:MAG: MATE family efflux transporter, partial [Clostridia bacterium]|nr:MATE family efflux transporter [Clostridia bacterium]
MPDRKRSLFSTLVLLAIPTVLEEILSTLLQYVDTAMVGQLGEKATASVSVTQTVSWLIGSIPAALSVGVIALIARAVGSGDGERIRKMAGQTVLLVLGSGVAIGAACAALSPFIPVWMGAAEDIRADASRYFLIVTVPMVFRTS